MIGVFDSGSGGLTVLAALRRTLTEHNLVYLGDHANAPYGERRFDDIHALTRANVARLFDLGCPLVVVACNTAAAVALRALQQEWLPRRFPDKRVLGVFVPMVEAITGQPWHGAPVPAARHRTVGVFATPRTTLTRSWISEIESRAPGIKVIQQQCPGLAALIERDAPDGDIGDAVGYYVQGLMRRAPSALDAVVLGCTHYPLIVAHFAAHLPPGLPILDQPAAVAASLGAYIERHSRFRPAPGETGATVYWTTGEPAATNLSATRTLNLDINFRRIEDWSNRAAC